MILASKEQIKNFGDAGCWGTRTLLDDFRQNVSSSPEHTALVDPLNKEALVGLAPERAATITIAVRPKWLSVVV
ncbi:MAG: hypothetical protein KAU27_15575 [Desulfuromonadales bacterium]|nr:hypothetical protein [Desulfuromonadales bacterium]